MEPERNVIPMPMPEHLNQASGNHHAVSTSHVPHLVEVPSLAGSTPDDSREEIGNIGKIRDILFGTQMRDYERRFARLEERLLKESNDLRQETQRRFDALEGFVKHEFATLATQLKAEDERRNELGDELLNRIQESARTLERKLAQLDEQSSTSRRELSEQLLAQANSLGDEIRRSHDAVTASLAREADELRDEKADRAALAELFSEMALRLNRQFRLPDELG